MITYIPEEDIVVEKVLEEYLLILLQTGERKHSRSVQINSTGAAVWHLLKEGKDPAGIIKSLSDTYEGAAADVLERDIHAFLESLCAVGYLKKEMKENYTEE